MTSPRWAYAAGIWARLFALPSFYWALGGETGMGTIAAHPDDIDLINEPVVVFTIGVAKLLAGLPVLTIVRAWGGPGFQRWLRVLALIGGGFMLLYGGALLIQHALMISRAVNIPDSLGERASRWHLGLWDPVWIVRGVLFLAAGRQSRR